jgi:ribonucleoside-diphosphate reductase alpha chain
VSFLEGSISQQIWDLKYRYRRNGKVIDATLEKTWLRVAKAVAKAEQPTARQFWQDQFYTLLEGFRFLPGGRILAGAGTQHNVTLFNCFVMKIAEDSMTGIFNALKEGALTLQQGGGVGYDFSVLRPEGDVAKKTGIAASGPVSFMRIWDTMCSVLLSTGARRGAMMGVLRCDHPDIEAFVTAKKDSLALRHFNVSVMVSDAFMQAVKTDSDWALVFQQQIKLLMKSCCGAGLVMQSQFLVVFIAVSKHVNSGRELFTLLMIMQSRVSCLKIPLTK